MSQLASPEEAQRFVDKWQGVALSERAASHEHFIDLCNLVRQADPTGQDYSFEKPVKVTLAASKGRVRARAGSSTSGNAGASRGETNRAGEI